MKRQAKAFVSAANEYKKTFDSVPVDDIIFGIFDKEVASATFDYYLYRGENEL